jgi:hypothetical protein
VAAVKGHRGLAIAVMDQDWSIACEYIVRLEASQPYGLWDCMDHAVDQQVSEAPIDWPPTADDVDSTSAHIASDGRHIKDSAIDEALDEDRCPRPPSRHPAYRGCDCSGREHKAVGRRTAYAPMATPELV